MVLTATLLLLASQSPPPPPPIAPPLPGARLLDDRDSLLTRIMAMDSQLRAAKPTAAAPIAGVGIGVAAIAFGLTALGISLNASGVVVLFLVLGSMAGVVGVIAAIVAGLFGWSEEVRRAQLSERRDRLMLELEQRLSPSSAAMPRTP